MEVHPPHGLQYTINIYGLLIKSIDDGGLFISQELPAYSQSYDKKIVTRHPFDRFSSCCNFILKFVLIIHLLNGNLWGCAGVKVGLKTILFIFILIISTKKN